MYRIFLTLLFMTVSSMAPAQVLESEVFATVEQSDFEVSFDQRIESAGKLRFENVVLLNAEDGKGISFDWIEESVASDIVEITVSPDGSIFNRTSDGDTPIARLGFTEVVARIEGQEDDRDIQLKGDTISATLAAFDELASGLFSINGLDIRSASSRSTEVETETDLRIDQVSLALSGNEAEWETIAVRVEDIELTQAGRMSPELSDQFETLNEIEDVNTLLALLNATFSGQTKIGSGAFFMHGTDLEEGPVDVKVGFRDYNGQTQFVADQDLALGVVAALGAFDLSVLAVPAQIEMAAEDYDIAFDMSLDAEDVRSLAIRLMEGTDPEPADFTSLEVEGRIAVGGAETSGRFEEGDMSGEFSLTAAEGSERIAFRDGTLELDVESGGFEARGVLPFVSPEELAMTSGGIAMRFLLPMIPGAVDAEQSMEIAMSTRDLLVSDAIWNMFDPEAEIVRDPVNVDIDVAMTGRLLEPFTEESQDLFDVFDPDAIEIRSYTISGGGAEISAEGETTLDLSQGMPAGEGKIFVTLKGVTGLVGKLVDLRVAPPEANIGILGGLGAFATQVEPDHYESEIEFFPDGRITTNGRPMPLGR